MSDSVKAMTHKQMGAQCFNEVWKYLDLAERTAEQNETMIHLCHTSFWHWTQVPDHTPTNISVGYWQLSRVYCVADNAETGHQYGLRCLEVSKELPPFYLGYAYEATTRALIGLKRIEEAKQFLAKAKEQLSKITIKDNYEYLKADLDQLEEML